MDRMHNRRHPGREACTWPGELDGFREAAAVVVRQDGSLDIYGEVAVLDQRPAPHHPPTCPACRAEAAFHARRETTGA